MPTPEQIAEVEAGLPKAFFDGERARGVKDPGMPDFYRQYVGLVVGGTRIIYVNAFLGFMAKDEPDWKTKPFSMCDDGANFGVEYVVADKGFRNFEVDGCLCFETRRKHHRK